MWHFESFSLSKREIIVSVIILALMITFGVMIHGSINDSLMLEYQEYNTALQIDNDTEMFKYAMKTDIGNTFAYGELKCIDTVTYPEIGGEYSYVKKVREEYTRHTRTVSNGKTSRTEVYYTWDEVNSESVHCKEISFLDVTFNYGIFSFPSSSYICTLKESSDVRYKYYGSPTSCMGTLYGDLRNNGIAEGKFYCRQTISETIKHLESGGELFLFWFGWTFLTGALIFAFIYVDNHWLEDNPRKSKNPRIYYSL